MASNPYSCYLYLGGTTRQYATESINTCPQIPAYKYPFYPSLLYLLISVITFLDVGCTPEFQLANGKNVDTLIILLDRDVVLFVCIWSHYYKAIILFSSLSATKPQQPLNAIFHLRVHASLLSCLSQASIVCRTTERVRSAEGTLNKKIRDLTMSSLRTDTTSLVPLPKSDIAASCACVRA